MIANLSEIDKAIQAVQRRKAARGEQTAATPIASAEGAAKASRKPRLTDEAKQARAADRITELAARRIERATARAARTQAKQANKRPAHLAKVARAAEMLTPLGQAATLLFNEATANLTAAELSALAAHINQFNREKATVRALAVRLSAGQRVTFTGGDPRFVGKNGTVTRAQRIRAYVLIDGAAKATYVFTSDVEQLVEQAAASNG